MEAWIKMRHGLKSHPTVRNIAARLKMKRLHVVGCCYAVWAWADQYSMSGEAMPITDAMIDEEAEQKGFAAAMRAFGWLDGNDGSLTFPRFHEHNGVTAKRRSETNRRVAAHRSGNGYVTNM